MSSDGAEFVALDTHRQPLLQVVVPPDYAPLLRTTCSEKVHPGTWGPPWHLLRFPGSLLASVQDVKVIATLEDQERVLRDPGACCLPPTTWSVEEWRRGSQAFRDRGRLAPGLEFQFLGHSLFPGFHNAGSASEPFSGYLRGREGLATLLCTQMMFTLPIRWWRNWLNDVANGWRSQAQSSSSQRTQ